MEMQLREFRPKQGADLSQLKALLHGRGWKSSLPTAVSDSLLVRLALDFRSVEGGISGRIAPGHEVHGLASAVYVVMNLLSLHPHRGGAVSELSLSEDALVRALKIYQWRIEREIVSRIVGDDAPTDNETLIDELWQCAGK